MHKTGVIFAIVRDKKILMQQRDGNCKRFPFMWCLPGGAKEESDKTYEDTLLREIKEEYGLDMKLEQCNYFMEYNEGADKVYLCRINQQQEPILKEGFDMRWMNIEEIEKLKLGFNQEKIIEVLKAII